MKNYNITTNFLKLKKLYINVSTGFLYDEQKLYIFNLYIFTKAMNIIADLAG